MTARASDGAEVARRDRLPLEEGDPVVTLNEGSTPLIHAGALSERLGATVYLQFEGANPTGSFKDRGMTVAVSRAPDGMFGAMRRPSLGRRSMVAGAIVSACT